MFLSTHRRPIVNGFEERATELESIQGSHRLRHQWENGELRQSTDNISVRNAIRESDGASFTREDQRSRSPQQINNDQITSINMRSLAILLTTTLIPLASAQSNGMPVPAGGISNPNLNPSAAKAYIISAFAEGADPSVIVSQARQALSFAGGQISAQLATATGADASYLSGLQSSLTGEGSSLISVLSATLTALQAEATATATTDGTEMSMMTMTTSLSNGMESSMTMTSAPESTSTSTGGSGSGSGASGQDSSSGNAAVASMVPLGVMGAVGAVGLAVVGML